MHSRTQAPLFQARMGSTHRFFLDLSSLLHPLSSMEEKENQEGSCGKVISALGLTEKTQTLQVPCRDQWTVTTLLRTHNKERPFMPDIPWRRNNCPPLHRPEDGIRYQERGQGESGAIRPEGAGWVQPSLPYFAYLHQHRWARGALSFHPRRLACSGGRGALFLIIPTD